MLDTTFSQMLERLALQITTTAAPGTPVRLMSNSRGENVYVLKMPISEHLTLPHCGHIAESVLQARQQSEESGTPVQVFFVDDKRERFRPFEQIALNPIDGRILFCAVGRGNAPQAALRKIALAERRWPQDQKWLDSDGFSPIRRSHAKREVMTA